MSAQLTIDDLVGRRAAQAVTSTHPALFLHTGWRSSGTWIWSRLRADPAVMAYYEPLHEQLATLTESRIAQLRPDSWRSGHDQTAPYYSEFRDLLAHRGRGVQGYQERFAADRYFLSPDAKDPVLVSYLGSLLHHATEAGRVPVLKFCRSLGRVGWMQRNFPDALHAVMLRDPVAQWRSSAAQLAQSDNRYFLVGPLLILARNAHEPLVAEALARLEVRLPALPSGGSLAFDQEICWRHIARLSWADRYRGFLAYWTVSAIAALSGDVLTIDADELLHQPGHRDQIEQAVLSRLGLLLSLGPRITPARSSPAESALEQDATARAHARAIDLLQSQGGALPEASFARILGKLAPALATTRPSRPTSRPQGRTPEALGPRKQALYFAGLRLSMPLRRLHGMATRWRRR